MSGELVKTSKVVGAVGRRGDGSAQSVKLSGGVIVPEWGH